MVVVSNEKITQNSFIPPNSKIISYDDFKQQAFYGDGIDENDIYMINVNNIENEVFNVTKEVQFIKYFTLNNSIPNFIDVNVDNWSTQTDSAFNNNINNSLGVNYNTNESNNPSSPNTINNINNTPDSSLNQGYNNQNEENLSENDKLMQEAVSNLLDESINSESPSVSGDKDAKIYVFGSSKGGTGKTFTSIISTYRYAKTHPHQKIALLDFDIIDGQVGISIHKIKPTMRNYFTDYQKGYRDFETMHNYCTHANSPYPQNVDFYLAPSSGKVINNDDFWFNIIENAIKNYDVVVFDTGIDYLNIIPISYAYKIADKINLVTTTSIKSVNSVTKQISKLKGETINDTYSKDDEISSKLNVIITQMVNTNTMNKTIYSTLSNKCNVVATFGVITDSISQAEFYGMWDIFDKNGPINDALDKIMA